MLSMSLGDLLGSHMHTHRCLFIKGKGKKLNPFTAWNVTFECQDLGILPNEVECETG